MLRACRWSACVTMRLMKTLLIIVCCAVSAMSQQIEVSKQNKTITVSADHTMKFAAEIVKLSIGRHDYAASQDEAFSATKNAMAKIIDSLHRHGVEDQAISTENLALEEQTRADINRPVPAQEKFRSLQRLEVIVPVNAAQNILDSAVVAGANDVGSPEWLLKDYDLAQAKTAGAALRKARLNAEQMAAGLGAKLGDLVYASNYVPNQVFPMRQGLARNAQRGDIEGGAPGAQPLKLFPQTVEVRATVYATFAIE